ncbi:hypothetical protein EV182_002926 [Spiromyces aspiralis]|uniref:Uncharacterized protein n=1 Tax=Spiromyces aspiralis TaxID=68401 RepID=A0ACC1HDH1_9FUNG|nr:hypothetical protein EV182_002926 [Spiromyces aspiralis]
MVYFGAPKFYENYVEKDLEKFNPPPKNVGASPDLGRTPCVMYHRGCANASALRLSVRVQYPATTLDGVKKQLAELRAKRSHVQQRPSDNDDQS